MDLTSSPSYAAAAGLLSHWAYFIHGEHHAGASKLFQLALLAPVLLFASLRHYAELDAVLARNLTTQIVASYLTSLWTSMILYRVFFHRLGNFPGPFMFKVSKLWHTVKLIPNSDNYLRLEELHKKYGDFVRTGPNEISIFDADAVPIILGPGSKCVKAPWYDAGLPDFSMHSTRDKTIHDKRRRIWDRGFGAKALRQYEDRVLGYSKNLLRQITARAGQKTNAAKWFHFYSFDVMGDIAFGKSFDMIETGKSTFELDLLAEGMKPVGTLTPIPWMPNILRSIPGLAAKLNKFLVWSGKKVQERKKIEMEIPDVMSWLIDFAAKVEKKDQRTEEMILQSDSRLIIVAGSDTTATTLTFIFYHLAQDPSKIARLRAELEALQNSEEEFNAKDLQDAEYLNGSINEALRLHPPVPSGVLRLTPPEGIFVGETFIPGNVTVATPSYTLGRQESSFERALEFIPERWYSKPEMIKNKSGFAPFSLGPYSCVGKQLALMELRTVVALLVSRFDVEFAEGEDGTRLLRDSMDCFTMILSDLDLVFNLRKDIRT